MLQYQPTHTPSYASASASGIGLSPQHLDVRNPRGLRAFEAGPRRDPLSRELHLMKLGESARGGLTAPSYIRNNTFGQGVTIPPGWKGSMESDILAHSQKQGLRPYMGGLGGLTGSGAAGAAHPNLGLLGDRSNGPPPASPHYRHQAAGYTEEERRMFLITGERNRRHAHARWQRTNTLGQYIETSATPRTTGHGVSLGTHGSYGDAYGSSHGGSYGGFGSVTMPVTSYLATPMHKGTSLETPAAPQRASTSHVSWAA